MADLYQLILFNAEFGLDLYHHLSANLKNENLFFSSTSISYALAMTMLGADGKTKEEMKSVLKFSEMPDDKLHSSFKELNKQLLDTKGEYKLHTANKLYGELTYTFLDEFLKNCEKFYDASLDSVDFKNKPRECESIINTWVEKQTNDKIKDLLPSGILDESTRLVIVNAIYFKGDWKNKFDAKETKDEYFFVTKDHKVKVPMMHIIKKNLRYCYHEELNSQIVELSYVNDAMSFVVILPDSNVTNLTSVEEKLTTDIFNNISRKLYSSENVELWLPKFKLQSSFEADDILKNLGITDLFVKGKADLSRMDGTKELYVSKVVHKAFVEVNEEGSEAAAATGVVISTDCDMSFVDPIIFRADHPFIFMIRNNNTGVYIFMGKLMKP